jgi:TorA maturation chaperone TorD
VSIAAAPTPVAVRRPLAPEESGRADFYALLARLFAEAPDAKFLQSLAIAPALEGEGVDPGLAAAWSALVAASAVFDPEAAAEEYETLFVGVGPSIVPIFLGFHAGASSADHPRVRIRRDLAALGLAPREANPQPEDHFALLFEAMRVMTGGTPVRDPAPVGDQKRFFETNLAPGVFRFLEAVAGVAEANYYRRVAAFGAAFMKIEQQSFSLG